MTVLLGLASVCIGAGITSLQGDNTNLDPIYWAGRSYEVSRQVQKNRRPKARRCNTDQGAHESSCDWYLNMLGHAFLLTGMLSAEA